MGRRAVQKILDRWYEHPPVDVVVGAVLAAPVGVLYALNDTLNTPGFAAPQELPGVFRMLTVPVGALFAGGLTLFVNLMKMDGDDGPRTRYAEGTAGRGMQRLIVVSLMMLVAALVALFALSLPSAMPVWTFLAACVIVLASAAAFGRMVWLFSTLRRLSLDDRLEQRERERRERSALPAPRAREGA